MDTAALLAEAQGYLDKGMWRFARTTLETLYAGGHRPAFTAQQLGAVCANDGFIQDGIRWHRQAIALEPRLYRSHENMIFLLDACAETTTADATAARRAWWHAFGQDAYDRRLAPTNVPDPQKPLRVGYVTGDVNFHSAAIAWTSVVSQHTSAVEAVLYSTLEPRRYDNRTRLWQAQCGGHFVDVSAMSAHELALTIHQDQVDLLVDLSGYTNNNRLLAFAYRPAPIQIQAWGYVLGTASPMIDVIFADPTVASPAIRRELTERVVDLPALLTYLPPSRATGCPADLPEATPLPCLTEGPTFSVFQRAMKVTAPALAAWREILARLPTARILFKGGDYGPTARTRIADALDPYRNRVVFDFNERHFDHLLSYQAVDLALDPWPQTGGVSTLEIGRAHV